MKITRRTFLSRTATLAAPALLALAGGCDRGGGGTATTGAGTTGSPNKTRRETLTVGYLPVT